MRTISLLFFLLAACTTTEQAETTLTKRYVGSSADKFFIENGAPLSSYKLDNGSKIYRWSSGEDKVTIPTTNTTRFNASGPGGFISGSATTWESYDIGMLCDLEILVSSKNIIKGIRAARDSAGFWETSRCNELFSRYATNHSKGE